MIRILPQPTIQDRVMTESTSPRSRKAHEIPAGNAVLEDGTLWLKVEREGKDFVQHYLVALAPRSDPARLTYVDPESNLLDCGGPLTIVLGGGQTAERDEIAFGAVFQTARGTFLKVREDRRTDAEKMTMFVDLASGLVRRRREQGVDAVFDHWRVDGVAGQPLDQVMKPLSR